MPKMTDFNLDKISGISDAISGKTIELEGVTVDDSGMNNMLVIKFTDGTGLLVEYDWIYGWELISP